MIFPLIDCNSINPEYSRAINVFLTTGNRQVDTHIVYSHPVDLRKLIMEKFAPLLATGGGRKGVRVVSLGKILLIFSLSFLHSCHKFDCYKQPCMLFLI